MKIKKLIQHWGYSVASRLIPELTLLKEDLAWHKIKNSVFLSEINKTAKVNAPYRIRKSKIGDYTYISENSHISKTQIGKFCSIGPNLICGWGIHPTDKLTTHPMFYSTFKQNGTTLSKSNKIEESKAISIGNDVFIGANVTILDGINIGDGAIIGAGAVVSKDIPPYAIAIGSPIKLLRYRFTKDKIDKLLKIKWWDFDTDKLSDVEKYFDSIDLFINKYSS
ncbi:CatB-related O-acetyltransferase [Saccharicrinis sp. 156]|uniref:CatB-related O-acetyltransferase n=1 Tax=Saccharicrinis sp. 156 TaxID=3417574 RepID=UPI003D336273